ncbi:SGNH/GDSL hydrolase family protein [Cyclobacterium amurskyense]|jgi:lysophospholipase L1-like esterase|uniref:SGNH/GDSL hydrolase family protein n=1 Tax=Cyclobacterium amurskyense TaxID=320787 RepID=UPI0030D92F72|tara:strand:+ start:2489 stop:3256 length:768 start_codon:yes stop_codon:yes gene_type:complete
MQVSRRKFFTKLGLTGLTGLSFPRLLSAINSKGRILNNIKGKGLSILFQGDSITDGARTRNQDWNHIMGHGYAYLVSSRLWFDYPKEELMFFNRGISGNKVTDLLDRWQEDTIDLKPDVLSIMIGVNDVARIISKEYSIEEWEVNYKKLLNKTRSELPNTTLILCEPFLLIDDWPKEKAVAWEAIIFKMQVIVRQLAKNYNTIHVELQDQFNLSLKKAPAKYWVWDGVHPMPAGHELIARIWIKEVSKKLDFIGK